MDNIYVGIIGFSTVFVVLVVLIAFITIMSKIINSSGRKEKEAQKIQHKESKKINAEEDMDEIAAVIAAAISCMGQREGKKYKIRSFRRA